LGHKDQVIALLTQFIFVVTGMHEQAGSVAEYVLDPSFLGGKIRAGQKIADVQASVQVLLLLAATGFKQPPLLGNYTHLFLEQHHREACEVFWNFQKRLQELSLAIAERNTKRKQAFENFNPALLQSSVSI
jgi:hypothetical protein